MKLPEGHDPDESVLRPPVQPTGLVEQQVEALIAHSIDAPVLAGVVELQPAADAALGVSSPAVSIVCHVRQTARLDSTARSSAVESAPCRTDGVPS